MPLPPLVGPGSLILTLNMKEARQKGMPRNMATPLTYYWFYQKVRNRGPWDYKQFDPYWQEFGNFNYGSAGTAAGIPENILLMGAGFAQSHAGTSRAEWGYWFQKPPYGDDPADQQAIREGIKYAIQHGY